MRQRAGLAFKVAEVGRPLGGVGDGAVLDLSLPAERFAQQDAGWRVAVGNGLDKHGYLLNANICTRDLR